jgi:hypothetical protein
MGGNDMGKFSIFHSDATWEKNNSKAVHRTDVETEEEMEEASRSVLRRGGKINGIIPSFQDELEEEQGVTAPQSGKKRSGRY